MTNAEIVEEARQGMEQNWRDEEREARERYDRTHRSREDLEKEVMELRDVTFKLHERLGNYQQETQRLKDDAFADRDEIERLKGALKAAHFLLDRYLSKGA